MLEHFPFTNAASQWLYVNLFYTDSIPAMVDFLWSLRFPPTPKNRNPFIFLVHSFWSLILCTKPAWLPQVYLPMCKLQLSHRRALRTQWVDMSHVTKTSNYYYNIIIRLLLLWWWWWPMWNNCTLHCNFSVVGGHQLHGENSNQYSIIKLCMVWVQSYGR